MDYHLQKSPVGANGVVFMPFLIGSGYPYWNSEAKGLFAGLKFSNTKSDMIRSVMEGITMESKDMYETMKASGVVIKSLAITGGATKSTTWRQIIADMFNVEIKRLKVSDATILGAAVLAGVGAGLFKSAEEGVAQLVHYTDKIQPIAENVAKYNAIYAVYKNMYNACNEKGIYTQLSALCD
jgi:xylulokinase